MRDGLMRLCRLRSLMISCLEAGEAGDTSQSNPKGLRSRGAHGVSPGPGAREPEALLLRAEDGCPSSSQEQICLSSTCFVLFGPSKDLMMPTHIGEGHLLYPVHQFKCQSLPPEPRSQTHPEIVFYQLPGHPLAQSSCHIELTITPRNIPPYREKLSPSA